MEALNPTASGTTVILKQKSSSIHFWFAGENSSQMLNWRHQLLSFQHRRGLELNQAYLSGDNLALRADWCRHLTFLRSSGEIFFGNILGDLDDLAFYPNLVSKSMHRLQCQHRVDCRTSANIGGKSTNLAAERFPEEQKRSFVIFQQLLSFPAFVIRVEAEPVRIVLFQQDHSNRRISFAESCDI